MTVNWQTIQAARRQRLAGFLADPGYEARRLQLEAQTAVRDESAQRVARRYAGIPTGFWEPIDHPDDTEAMAAVRTFLASDKLVLLMAGDVGRGKSVAAAWAVDQVRGAKFFEAAKIARANVYDSAAWLAFFSPSLLAIDELGMETMDPKGWCESKLYELVNDRIQSGKQTILVTNLDPKAFLARYPDPRLRDRIRAHAQLLHARGPSMRRA
jgi:DNA replication protein DnaC